MSERDRKTGSPPATAVREVVGLFADRRKFEGAVAALRSAGFDRADLSVLGSHESIDAAGRPSRPFRDMLTALFGEAGYVVPISTAGFIMLAAGPIGDIIAGLVAAGLSGAAIKEALGEVMARPHTEDFARALEAGAVILWVRVTDDEGEARAKTLLKKRGAKNVHTVERTN